MNIYIKKYSRILNGKLWVDGKLYLESPHIPFDHIRFMSEVYHQNGIDYRKFFKMDLLSRVGFILSEFLLVDFEKDKPKEDMGILLFNRSSSLEADYNYQQTIRNGEDYYPSPAVFVYTLPNIVTGEIAIRNKIHGETAFYVFSRPEPASMVEISTQMMHSTGINHLLLGWLEVCRDNMDAWMILCERGGEGRCKLDVDNIKSTINGL